MTPKITKIWRLPRVLVREFYRRNLLGRMNIPMFVKGTPTSQGDNCSSSTPNLLVKFQPFGGSVFILFRIKSWNILEPPIQLIRSPCSFSNPPCQLLRISQNPPWFASIIWHPQLLMLLHPPPRVQGPGSARVGCEAQMCVLRNGLQHLGLAESLPKALMQVGP